MDSNLDIFQNDECNNIKQSFQDGCNIIINKIQSIGVTPSDNSPTAIANAIQEIRDGSLEAGRQQVTGNPNNYNLFTAEQYNNHYNEGYNSGRTQGQNDVKSNPNNYGLYNKTQYDNHYNNGRTQGQNDVKNNPNGYGLYNKTQYDQNYTNGYNAGVNAGQSSVAGSYNIYFVVNARGGPDGRQWMKYEDQITITVSSNGTPSLGSPSFMNAQIRDNQGEYYTLKKNIIIYPLGL